MGWLIDPVRKGFDWYRRLTLLQPIPVVKQFLLVQLRPGLHQPSLARGQRSRDQVDRLNSDDGHLILPVGVEVRYVVLPAGLGEHADDDSEKAAEFRHL